jgi:hypothetical protein
MSQQQTGVRAVVRGRITVAPELSRTTEGVAVCRFRVATDAGPASRPLVKDIYIKGNPELEPSEDLPVRVKANLGLGDLVRVPGVELQRSRRRRGVEFIETAIQADDVQLKQWAAERTGAP